jgi:hypothetical protein
MRKALRCIAILTLLFVQLQGIFTLNTADVKAQEETVLLDNDAAKVTVTPSVTATNIEWTIDYARYAPSDAAARAIRFKLATAADGSGTVQRKDGDLKEKADGDDWYRESASTTEAKGKLLVTTAKDVKQLVVWTQVDMVNMGQVTGELLSGATSSAKVVAAPEIPAEDKQEEVAVDQTPVDTTDPAASLPAAPVQEATDSAAVQKEPTPANTTDADVVDTSKEDVAGGGPATVAAATNKMVKSDRSVLRIGNSSAKDVFNYTTDDDGTYPEHGTNSHVNGSATTVKNYDYAGTDQTAGVPAVSSILTTGSNFVKGYHHYQGGSGTTAYNVYTKKSIRPVNGTTNQFQVQLDMIGDAIRPIPNVDIVLVLDKSTSMNSPEAGHSKSKWAELQDAVRNFSNDVLNSDNNVRIGMTSFGTSNQRAWTDIAKFSGSGFTNSAAILQGHSLYTSSPGDNSGTPTAIGVDSGLYLLNSSALGARGNAKKIIVTITDGDPTYYPESRYYANQSVNQSINNNTTVTTNTTYNHYVVNNNYFTRGGSESTPTAKNNTITFLNYRLGQAMFNEYAKYAIGFGSGVTSNAVLVANGPDGQFSANDVTSLLAAMHTIIGEHTNQIVNATLNDPMSQYVALATNSVNISALTLENGALTVIPSGSANFPSYASSINTSGIDTSGIVLKSINLGGTTTKQYGLRVTYTVTLRDDYRDGQFYQTNKTTTLQNNNQDEYLHFAVPSVRDTTNIANLQVDKVWDDQADKFDTRDDVQFQLQRRLSSTGSWTNFRSATLSNGASSLTFRNLQIASGSAKYQYRVVETSRDDAGHVPGYGEPTYAPTSYVTLTAGDTEKITVTNKLKYAAYTFTKQNEDGKELSGAKFAVYRNGSDTVFTNLESTDGKFSMTNLPIGTYTVKETTAPDGYTGKNDFTVFVKDVNSGPLTVTTDKINGNVVKNTLKPFALSLLKTNADMTFLAGAKFKISGNGLNLTATTNQDGQLTELADVQFTTGSYTIEELVPPYGYKQLQGHFTLVIKTDGSVDLTYSDVDIGSDDYKMTSELTADGTSTNKIYLTLKNHESESVPLPLTGGSGIGAFIVIGIVIMGTVGYLKLVDWRKKRGGDGNA